MKESNATTSYFNHLIDIVLRNWDATTNESVKVETPLVCKQTNDHHNALEMLHFHTAQVTFLFVNKGCFITLIILVDLPKCHFSFLQLPNLMQLDQLYYRSPIAITSISSNLVYYWPVWINLLKVY